MNLHLFLSGNQSGRHALNLKNLRLPVLSHFATKRGINKHWAVEFQDFSWTNPFISSLWWWFAGVGLWLLGVFYNFFFLQQINIICILYFWNISNIFLVLRVLGTHSSSLKEYSSCVMNHWQFTSWWGRIWDHRIFLLLVIESK